MAGNGTQTPITYDLINGTYTVKPPSSPREWGSEALHAGEHVEGLGRELCSTNMEFPTCLALPQLFRLPALSGIFWHVIQLFRKENISLSSRAIVAND